MHVKIQGGGDGKYANRESCTALVNYLQHEDKERLEKEGVNIEKSITYQFSHIECLKGFLDERTQQDIINKINQKHPTPKPISEPEPPAPTTNREQGNRVW